MLPPDYLVPEYLPSDPENVLENFLVKYRKWARRGSGQCDLGVWSIATDCSSRCDAAASEYTVGDTVAGLTVVPDDIFGSPSMFTNKCSRTFHNCRWDDSDSRCEKTSNFDLLGNCLCGTRPTSKFLASSGYLQWKSSQILGGSRQQFRSFHLPNYRVCIGTKLVQVQIYLSTSKVCYQCTNIAERQRRVQWGTR